MLIKLELLGATRWTDDFVGNYWSTITQKSRTLSIAMFGQKNLNLEINYVRQQAWSLNHVAVNGNKLLP